ncbi:MAG TPA: response regulator transcription factor [Longimicrobiales bacterium]|nr:response regulator transcription factor [Longimicrobiales bacterium]
MASRVLVVEDDYAIARVVRRYLEREGYAVALAGDGATGLRSALAEPPDLIVLDWMLPGLDGPEFLRRLRERSAAPVIMLTARVEEADRVAGLELGADDYVTKPFSPRELVARVKAVLRRLNGPGAEGARPVRAGPLVIDPVRRSARLAGRELDLTTLEFDLLHCLASHPGRVWTRDELLARVWGEGFTGVDRVVDVHVHNLRRKVQAAHAGTELLGTVRGVGYRFEDRPA